MPKKKPSTDVLLGLCLDKSGSMGHLAAATVEGINAFFDEQRAIEGKALLSLILFDTSFEVRYVAQDLSEVPALGSNENRYTPSGGTALYDAVSATIQGTSEWLANHTDFAGKVLVVINTDGAENSSQTTTLDQVNALITEKTAEGWEFVFMGAGQAAWTEGTKFTSIPQESNLSYAATGAATMDSYNSLSTSAVNTRTTGAAFTVN